MIPSWNFFLVFSFVVASTKGADEYCYAKDDKPYAYFGTKTPYSNVRLPQISTPRDCSVIYVWSLIRHGTRYPCEDDAFTADTLNSIRDEIVNNHEKNNRGKLCKEDLDAIKNWKYPWDGISFGTLMPQGFTDMKNLAKNLKTQLESLKTASKDKFRAQTSTKSRCQNSAIAFTNELYGTISNDVDDNNIQINNYMLRTQDRKKASEIDELNKFKGSILMDGVLSQISDRLGFSAKLDFDFVRKLYVQCISEKGLDIGSKPAFCAAFTPDHMKIMEYCEDLDTYYTLGHGEPKFKNQACPLLLDLNKKLENAQIQQNPAESGNWYFAHREILIPLLTKLGLFRDSQPLTSDNYGISGESRQWKTSRMSPFGANFIAVMYNCGGEKSVSFYLNEASIKFPFCNDVLCSWKTWKEEAPKNDFFKDCTQAEDLEGAKDQKTEEKKTSENTRNSANSADVAKETELKEGIQKVLKQLLSEMEKEKSATTEDERIKILKEIKSKLEAGDKGSTDKKSNSEKDSGSGAAGLKSMEFQTICLMTLFTIIVGIFGKFMSF